MRARWIMPFAMLVPVILQAAMPATSIYLRAMSGPVADEWRLAMDASPGAYSLQTASGQSESWLEETNFAAGWDGVAEVGIHMQGRTQLGFRVVSQTPSNAVNPRFWCLTQGSNFAPEVHCDGGTPGTYAWVWSDGATDSNYPLASKDFGTPGDRTQRLVVEPASVLTSINLGFDGADGGETTPLDHRPPQNVGAVFFAEPLTGLLYWASSYCPLTNTLDFSGFTRLEAIECFNCSPLRHVFVTNLPALQRACFEDCDLRELDLSGNPNLGDLRGAVNAFTEIKVGRGTGPKIWHWCTRDNPQLTQNFADIMTNFYVLRELFIWNDNQHGHLRIGSTNLGSVIAYDNHYTSADFSGQDTLQTCSLYGNDLTNLVLDGCAGLREVDAHNNRLPAAVLDTLLAVLDAAAPNLNTVDLSQNAQVPSSAGYHYYSNLTARGVSVLLDWPEDNDGRLDVPGGTNAITFVTTSQAPHMEIQIAGGVPDSVIWHWGDGIITRGATVVTHNFGAAVRHTNYVEVLPPARVRYFGAQQGHTFQGIAAVHGARNFPNLDFLFLYQEALEEMSLAGCANLRQLHLADNPVPVAVCDQWFVDLDAAITGAVTQADFYYPAARRSAASDAAWSNLVAKGFTMSPM